MHNSSNSNAPPVTTRRTTASKSNHSIANSNDSINNNNTTNMHNTSKSTSSSKWKLVRPWAPPTAGNSSSLEDGQDDHDTTTQDEDEDGEDSTTHMLASEQLIHSTNKNRLYLEVRDVSSTSVSLSVFGQPAATTVNHEAGTSASSSSASTSSHHLLSSHNHHEAGEGGANNHNNTAAHHAVAGASSMLTGSSTTTPPATSNLTVNQRSRSRAASTSSERYVHQQHSSASHPQQPPNISIKLNSAAWPHVFHTDSSFFDAESGRSSNEENAPSASSILVWGLSPGQNYHIELGVFDDLADDDDEGLDGDDLSDASETEEGARAAASIRTLDATEPDVPPPPYSSHDPSSAGTTHNDAEVTLRSILDQLRLTTKQKEASLQSSISSMRRANDKLTREDQRHRQRIHMLEDSTTRLREVAADEDAEHEAVREQTDDLEETEKTLISRLERRRNQIEKTEKHAKEELDKDEGELAELRERLDKITEREEEVLAKKLKLEREQLPTYNIQLATLEADLRRLVDDHRRRFPYQHHLPPHAFSTQLAHNQNVPNVHANHAIHNAGRGSAIRPLGRGGHVSQNAPTSSTVSSTPGPAPAQVTQTGHHMTSADDRAGLSSPVIPEDTIEATLERNESSSSSNRPRHVSSPGLLNLSSKDRDTGYLASVGPSGRNRSGSLRVGPGLQDTSRQQASPTSAVFGQSSLVAGETSQHNSPVEQEELSQPTAVPTTINTSGSEVRTSSRFGWSKPNTWASKVASGVRQGGNSVANSNPDAGHLDTNTTA